MKPSLLLLLAFGAWSLGLGLGMAVGFVHGAPPEAVICLVGAGLALILLVVLQTAGGHHGATLGRTNGQEPIERRGKSQ